MFKKLITVSVLVAAPYSAYSAFSEPSSVCGKWHEIVKGDSLSLVAASVYGDAKSYDLIYQANLDTIGDDPAVIEVGTEIFVPCDAADMPLFTDWFQLPTPVDLANLQKIRNVQIIDIRPEDKTGDEHILNSVQMPFSLWRGPADNPGEPPSEEVLSALLGENGIRLDHPTVIVHGKDNPMDMGRAAMVYWLLKSVGATQIGILEGGMQSWKAENMPLVGEPISLPAYTVEVVFSDTWRATPDEVEAIASGQLRGTLVDARPEGIFSKTDDQGQRLATTLPTAISISGPAAFSTYKKASDQGLALLERLKGSDVNWESEPIINFCNTGEIGALNWFYASELSGIKNVKLYPESSHGWKHEGNDLAPGQLVEAFRR